ncbi:MAG: DinB family protein [Chloroflexi bacterium]|nr:DinB family protein [Chloroflexota bacterium]
MITPQEMAGLFAINTQMIKSQTDGLTHADSVLQPPIQGNCLNWVLGHILDTRNGIVQQLGQPALISEAQAKRYGYGSEPVCADGDDILKLEQILALLEQSQQMIDAALANITQEELDRQVQTYMGPKPLKFYLNLYYRHETYHLGQTEILRELALASK